MSKKTLNKKELFGHYVTDDKKENNEIQEIKNSRNQEFKKSRNLEIKNSRIQEKTNFKKIDKTSWKKINFRINPNYFQAIKLQALLTKTKTEDLFDEIISDYLKKNNIKI